MRNFRRTASALLPALFMLGLVFNPIRVNGQDVSATPAERTHIVTYGDTLVRIAQYYGVSWQEVAAINGLTNINTIFIGQRLVIPEPLPPGVTPSPMPPTITSTPAPPTNSPTASSTPLPPTPEPITPFPSATPVTASGVLQVPTALIPTNSVPVQPVGTIMLMTPITPSPTATLTLTPLPPTPTPPTGVNGIPNEQILVMDDAVRANIRSIFARGQELARNPRAFSKVGDSTIENPFFLARFDGGSYDLGDYSYLQPVIDYYAGSFGRDSIAVRVGLHSWSVLDPMWADPYTCNGGESLLACEIRRHNPSVIFIRLGSNDAGVPGLVERSLREIVEFCILNGIIPIMGTKADRFDGSANRNNEIIRQIAREYQVPLWDFDLLAGTIPGRGLLPDGVHMTSFYAHDWTQPGGFTTGHGVHSLTALIALDAIMETLGVQP